MYVTRHIISRNYVSVHIVQFQSFFSTPCSVAVMFLVILFRRNFTHATCKLQPPIPASETGIIHRGSKDYLFGLGAGKEGKVKVKKVREREFSNCGKNTSNVVWRIKPRTSARTNSRTNGRTSARTNGRTSARI